MPLEAPFWWYRRKGVLGSALAPWAACMAASPSARFAQATPYRSRLPVICIGNFTAGGGGKTPTAMPSPRAQGARGRPAFLTRGYGGASKGPVLVTKATAAEVGDEPLLLADAAPTMVGPTPGRGQGHRSDRCGSSSWMTGSKPGLAKDLSLVVVDGGAGIGNGLVIPAGPLSAARRADRPRLGAVVIGEGGKVAKLIAAFTAQAKPVLKARMVPRQDRRWLSVLPVIGFAGIARPAKFFATLRNEGARLIDTRAYPDHYRYSERQARSLLKEAKDYNAMLVTTEKDYVRLDGEPDSALAELKHRARPFAIAVEFADKDAVKQLLATAIASPRGDASRGSA